MQFTPVLDDVTGDTLRYTVELEVAFKPGNDVFYVSEQNNIIVTTVRTVHIRIRDEEPAVVLYGCQQRTNSGYNEYSADRLFGTVDEAVAYVKERLAS